MFNCELFRFDSSLLLTPVLSDNTFTASSDGSATLHVSQLPPNPAILVPGPALLFVVVNGVPSNGTWIMVGSGKLGAQTVTASQVLPASKGGDGNPANRGNTVVSQTSIASAAKSGATGTTGSGSSGSTGSTGSTAKSSWSNRLEGVGASMSAGLVAMVGLMLML